MSNLNIKSAREALGLSQSELAVRMGVSQSAISLWENGRVPKVPMISFIEGLLKQAGVDPANHQFQNANN